MERNDCGDVRTVNFTVLGGDRRQALLAGLLARDGHTVSCFALGGAAEAGSPAEAARGAECVVLPMPVCAAPGVLNTPLSEITLPLEDALDALPKLCLLVGGRVDAYTAAIAASRGRTIEDLLRREELAVGNAVATAEGAVELLLRETPYTLWRSRVLVLGYGRIGRLLCPRLAAFGAQVSAAARKQSDRTWIEAAPARPLDIGCLSGRIGDFDLIVNTVPAPVLPESLLRETKPEALLLELASAPGGFDPEAAERLGRRTLRAPGLPGKCAPLRAAELLRESIYNLLEERHGKA